MAGALHAQLCSNNLIAGNGDVIGGVTITRTVTGITGTRAPGPLGSECGQTNILPSGAVVVPFYDIALGSWITAGSVTFHFSQPVNDVVFLSAKMNGVDTPVSNLTISANAGTVTTTTQATCGVSKSGNTFTANAAASRDGYIQAKVTSTVPYTSITFNAPTQYAGAGNIIMLCATSIVPALPPCTPGDALTFTMGASSARCQAAGSVTYTATNGGGTTGIVYSISNTGTGTQPTINSATGQVTYAVDWSGTSVITATPQCSNPTPVMHTVTTSALPGVPVFSSPGNERCSGAGTVTYTATSANAESITYSISNAGTGTQPTINPATGQVTYAANWSGTSTITATAAGCGTTASSDYVVHTAGVHAIADEATGEAATPLVIDVLANDLCNPDPNTLTIVTQPANGTIQIGAGGVVTYLPNGNFAGTDTFVYQVCTGPSGECSQATVTVTIIDDGSNACSTASFPHTYYLPFPENQDQLRKSLKSAGSNTSNNTNNVRSIISIKANYTGTVIYYDHWEDGYEPEAGTRTQSTTQIWGDGDTSNGTAPGYPTDNIPEGAIITIDNTYNYRTGGGMTTTATPNQYDGRDKIYSTKMLTISKVTGTSETFTVQTVKTNVTDVSRFGELFVLPLGENISSLANPTIATSAFRYTGVFVRASEDGTVVELDYDRNGTVDVISPTLAEGQVWFYDGTASSNNTGIYPGDTNNANDIKAGAILTSNKPVGVDMIFGGIDAYGTRNIPVLPGKYYGDTYYSPVHTTNAAAPVYAVFNNSLSEPITLNWSNGLGNSGTITIPASGYTSMAMSQQTGYKFQSTNGKSYTAITVIDADSDGSAYDWAFNMIPQHQLTNFATTAWAPGMASAGMANPVWVTPTETTIVYVKYNGNVMTGTGSTSPCGLKYDAAYPLSALQSQKIGINGGNNGMSLFTCDGTPISTMYGQDAGVAAASGATTLDVGFTLDPQCMDFTVFANDDSAQTMPEIPVIIPVLNNDVGIIDPSKLIITSSPSNGTVVVNPNGTITYTPNNGFTGTDIFTYQICNQAGTLCDTAVVTVSVGCNSVEWKHVISGKIFEDGNKNGILDLGEDGYQHTVNLYIDANANGILDPSETAPVQSITTDATGTYVFQVDTPAATTQASHDFATANYAGGLGWFGNWTEEGETTSPTAGNIQIVSGQLRFTGNAVRAIKRTVNTPLTNALLSFDFRTENMDGLSAEKLTVEVGPTSTGPWTELGSLHSITGFSSGSKSYNIPSSVVGTGMTVRFSTSGIDGDFFYIDNVQVQSIPTMHYIAELAKPLPGNMAQTLPVAPQTNYPITLAGFGSRCNVNFGLADSYCYKPGAVASVGNPALISKVGITSLNRAGAAGDNWPAVRTGGWLVLEAKTKGFVPNRVEFSGENPVGIVPSNFIEGMLVYDTTNKCLKMYTSTDGGTNFGWYCISTQTCPD